MRWGRTRAEIFCSPAMKIPGCSSSATAACACLRGWKKDRGDSLMTGCCTPLTLQPACGCTCGLAPHGSTEVVFADGYADSMEQAQQLIKKYLKLPVSSQKALQASFDKRRILHGFGAPTDEAEEPGTKPGTKKTLFSFSPDGTELSMDWDTPRPWTHVIANEREYGVVLNNEGEIYSFMGNSQQNGVTPFSLNNAPVQVPGQALYLYNMETGALDSPTFSAVSQN